MIRVGAGVFEFDRGRGSKFVGLSFKSLFRGVSAFAIIYIYIYNTYIFHSNINVMMILVVVVDPFTPAQLLLHLLFLAMCTKSLLAGDKVVFLLFFLITKTRTIPNYEQNFFSLTDKTITKHKQ